METPTPLHPRLRDLALTFPAMRWADDRHLETLESLAEYAKVAGHGVRCACQFVLSVWNPQCLEPLGLPAFDIHEAMGCWDPQMRAAFVVWARDPWWM